MKQIKFFAIILVAISSLFAKEPSGIIIGAGVGGGYIEMDIEHSQIMRYPILQGNNNNTPRWNARYNQASKSWALAWEILFGYKHFINDWVGLRYYANVGFQHYRDTNADGKKRQPIGVIDYTLNADLLLDFYTSERVAFGIFGGVGFGGSSFDKNIVNRYMDMYNKTEGIPIGASETTNHFFDVSASVGLRIAFFQRVNIAGIRSCDSYFEGRRSCSTPVGYIGHNLEVVAKFPMLEYVAVNPDVKIDTQNNTKFVSRPGYKVKNPYKFTIRYIIEF